MSQYTKELKSQTVFDRCPLCYQPLRKWDNPNLNTQVIQGYEGCAGLNPGAFRECVEACQAALTHWHDDEAHMMMEEPKYLKMIRIALTHATKEETRQ